MTNRHITSDHAKNPDSGLLVKSPDYNTYRGSLGMSLGVGPFSVLPLSLAPAAYVTDKPRLACVKS